MCGISAILDPTASPPLSATLARMHAPIRHRGPDDERMLSIARDGAATLANAADALPREHAIAAFAFRRLKIIDLSDAAAQPMPSESGMTWVVFNGEIYNFRELREELAARGHRFRTRSDTEAIVAAYEEWGVECFNRLEGMWAIVIADLRRRTLIGCRDRFGIKPLHWARAGTSLLLASEIRQLVAAMPDAPQANASRVALHLRGTRYPTTEETFVEGIRSVPPATFFEMPFDAPVAEPVFRPYWKLDAVADESMRYEDAQERFANVFRDAIRSHHVADVGLGSLLSGGLDSSTIAAVLGPDLPTYSFGFRGGPYAAYSEMQFVDAMAAKHGLRNFETTFDGEWVAKNVARVVETVEEPPLAMPVLAQFRVFELCRQHGTTVVLDGQGSDEILAGYPYHQRLMLMDDLRHARVPSFVRELRAIARRGGIGSWQLAKTFFLDPLLRRGRAKMPWIRGDYGRADLAVTDVSADPSPLNQRLYFDLRWGNVKIILGYADRNAMAHSIESRVPFFDRRLVELAFALPARFKSAGGDTKRILRDFARRNGVPESITERRDRMGFATPDAPLIEGPLRAQILSRVRDFASAPCFDRDALESLLRRFDDPRAIWRIYTLALWADAFGARLV